MDFRPKRRSGASDHLPFSARSGSSPRSSSSRHSRPNARELIASGKTASQPVNPDEFVANPTPSPVVRPVATSNEDAQVVLGSSRLDRMRGWIVRQARYSPARLALGVFAAIIVLITALLSLPIATNMKSESPFVDTLFTAVSAVCVTGLTTVDTATYWTPFGQAVIALGIMIGGLGVMTLASILGFAVSRHLGLTQRMLAVQETGSDSMGQITNLIKAVIATSLTAEFVLFLVFLPRFLTMGEPLGKAIWESIFMSISVFNNAGFVIVVGGLAPHVNDWWMLMPIILGTMVGALGFPVIQDLAARWRTPARWALHTKLTLSVYIILMFVGSIMLALTEWTNPETLGELDTPSKILNALLAGVNSRSSGLSAVDVGVMRPQTHFVQDILMMIGGGSASTAGGVKVTTFAVLVLAVVAEARGDQDIETFGRRIPPSVVRLAVAVSLLGLAMVAVSVVVLLSLTNYSLDVILFETISAFATVGLSTGITPTLPDAAKYILALLMFFGRTGTMTIAAALALRERSRVIRMPEERPIIG
ncbi:TrkH family potassium uptake protein [Schaalia vaccimaxillae]|uniref:TrkH family potassium uptake protein n=1 Tax=Schaalia vaccimaxillae TaxID=183916 RepID=UPI0003B49CE9|nr:potassium transporter TrkG [Schaalia vaccimaxillae]